MIIVSAIKILFLSKKNFLSKHIDSYIINNVDHLAYYMNKIDDSIFYAAIFF